MKKYLDIKGRSVVDQKGTLLGSVEDCIFDFRTNRLCSLIVAGEGLLSSSSILPLSSVVKLGDTIIYGGSTFRCRRKKLFMNRIITLNEILGKHIINLEGENEGKLADLIIDEDTGEILALICSRGLVEDLVGGRRLVLMRKSTTLINHRILVYKSDMKPLNGTSINRYVDQVKGR
jgi:uncharacterized protein YrrD